jgi:hypothetical protein
MAVISISRNFKWQKKRIDWKFSMKTSWANTGSWELRVFVEWIVLSAFGSMSKICLKIGWKKNFTEKPRKYVKLLIAMQQQLKFELILIYNKATIDNKRNFYFFVTAAILLYFHCRGPPSYVIIFHILIVLLWNHWTKWSNKWKGLSLWGSLSKLCLTVLPFNMAAVTKK